MKKELKILSHFLWNVFYLKLIRLVVKVNILTTDKGNWMGLKDGPLWHFTDPKNILGELYKRNVIQNPLKNQNHP